MSVTLVSTVSGATSNSYVSLADADAYFLNRLNSSANGDWFTDSAGVTRTDDVRKAALITATWRIDEESFIGVKVLYTAALKWPRYDVYDEDGRPFVDTSGSPVIPERVKQATYLTALELLKADFLAEDYLNNFEFLSTGTMQFKQFTQKSAGRLPSEAARLLRLVMTSGTGGSRAIRA